MGRWIASAANVGVGVALLGPVSVLAQDQDPSVTVTNAILYVYPDAGEVTDFAYGAEGSSGSPSVAYFFYEFCYPPTHGETSGAGDGSTEGTFTVGVDGELAGDCSRTARQGTANRTSTVTGQYDKAAGTVRFQMQGQSVNTLPQGVLTYTLVMDGAAAPLEGDRAKSRAPFSFTCTSSSSGNPCPYTSITGTAEVDVIFPELSGAPDSPDAAAPAGSGGGGGSSSTGLFVVGGIVAALAVGAALEAKRRRDKQAEDYKKAQVRVGSDASGGYEDSLEYGEGAGSAAPAASKAYEALVVGSSPQSAKEEPLVNDPESKEIGDEREREKESGSDTEGR